MTARYDSAHARPMRITTGRTVQISGGRALMWGRIQPETVRPKSSGSEKLREKPASRQMPLHSFRVDDAIWSAAKAKAAEEGITLSDVLRGLLADWLRERPL